MAGPIYKLFMLKLTEAWYQLSEEERNRRGAEVAASLERAGGKSVIDCNSAWSSEEWLAFGVQEFPNIEAVQKHAQDLTDLDWYR